MDPLGLDTQNFTQLPLLQPFCVELWVKPHPLFMALSQWLPMDQEKSFDCHKWRPHRARRLFLSPFLQRRRDKARTRLSTAESRHGPAVFTLRENVVTHLPLSHPFRRCRIWWKWQSRIMCVRMCVRWSHARTEYADVCVYVCMLVCVCCIGGDRSVWVCEYVHTFVSLCMCHWNDARLGKPCPVLHRILLKTNLRTPQWSSGTHKTKLSVSKVPGTFPILVYVHTHAVLFTRSLPILVVLWRILSIFGRRFQWSCPTNGGQKIVLKDSVIFKTLNVCAQSMHRRGDKHRQTDLWGLSEHGTHVWCEALWAIDH